MNFDEEREQDRRFAAVCLLQPHGFRPLGAWLFYKNGVTYDLSAADLSRIERIERIEREGLFVVARRGRFQVGQEVGCEGGYVIYDEELKHHVWIDQDRVYKFLHEEHAKAFAAALNLGAKNQ